MKFNSQDKRDYLDYLNSQAKAEKTLMETAKNIKEELMHNVNFYNINQEITDIRFS